MRIESVSATEFARNLASIMDKVRYTGKPIAITKGVRTMATLMPPQPTGLPIEELVELLESAPKLDTQTSNHFAQDLKKIRSSSQQELNNPWD